MIEVNSPFCDMCAFACYVNICVDLACNAIMFLLLRRSCFRSFIWFQFNRLRRSRIISISVQIFAIVLYAFQLLYDLYVVIVVSLLRVYAWSLIFFALCYRLGKYMRKTKLHSKPLKLCNDREWKMIEKYMWIQTLASLAKISIIYWIEMKKKRVSKYPLNGHRLCHKTKTIQLAIKKH